MRRVLALFFAIAVPLSAYAWWNDEWTASKTLTLDTSPTGLDIKANIAEVPVLVRLHTGNFADFLSVAEGGADFRFVAADGQTVLPHHIERFDSIDEIGLVWVRMPALGPGNPSVSLYYGNADASNDSDPAGTYDGNQVLVYHFSDADGAVKDQTAKGNNPTRSSAEPVAASLIGGGVRFSGSNRIDVPNSPTLAVSPEAGWTASAWVKVGAEQADAHVLHAQDGGNSLILAVDGLTPYAAFVGNGKTIATPRSATISAGAWHQLAMVVKGSRIELFVDGNSVGVVEGAITAMNPSLTIGAGPAGNGLAGEVDEVGISNNARAPEWLRTQARSQAPDSQYLRIGEAGDSGEAASQSYFTAILQNVTVDGWVVIGMLAVMGLVSWIVMVAKAGALRRTEQENRDFLKQFRGLPADHFTDLADKNVAWLRDLAEEDDDGKQAGFAARVMSLLGVQARAGSPLAEIYLIAVKEVRRRLSPAVGAAGRLPRASIEAIRATLDGAMVRETQRLNGKMVLLTISIAGGPFLGLLGTVVGVMITFAAIAATGDVNINAIAPGIAAALVATVAGLAVAIPALFGYNWLGSRIKDQVANMHVFADEVVTRLSEEYSA
jgi:biopolymer transport protein ExbB